jgi:hypothetical protein
MTNLDQRLAEAVRAFWQTRQRQSEQQGRRTGTPDQGGRRAVTAGGHLNGFINLTCELLVENGIPAAAIYRTSQRELPGYFRPTKDWDVVVVSERQLVTVLEFKSQVGPSFGNNYNNRTEEAVGSASDLWTAYREGGFAPSPRPCLGYFMLCEGAPASTRPVRVQEPHFKVFEEFRDASYAKRYELLCQRMVRERLYDVACLMLSDRTTGIRGAYREPSPELSFRLFIATLIGRATVFTQLNLPHDSPPE